MPTSTPDPASRRVGDTIAIPGDYQYRATKEGPAPQRFWHQTRFAACLELLELRSGLHLIDVGCGSGMLASMAAEVDGVDVLAVDANPEAIAFCRERWGGRGIRFERALLDELDLPPASADRITLLEVVEHIHRPQALELLRSFRTLLKPGGLVVVSTPNLRSLWPGIEWLLDRVGPTKRMAEEQHVQLYSPASLRALIEEAGLECVEERRLFVASPWVAGVSWRLAQHLHGCEMRVPELPGCLLVICARRPLEGDESLGDS